MDVVIDDIATTRTYLQNLASDAKGESEVKRVQDSVSAIVNAQLIALEGEIDNLANPGFGDRAKSHLAKIAQTLQVAQIPTLSYTGNTPSQDHCRNAGEKKDGDCSPDDQRTSS